MSRDIVDTSGRLSLVIARGIQHQLPQQLPVLSDDVCRDDDDDIWLIPTAETQLISLHRYESLALERLPVRYVAHTACFRRDR